MKSQFKIIVSTLSLALAGEVSAATSWTLNESATGTTVGGVTVVATGWADTGTAVGSYNKIEAQLATSNVATTHFVTYSGGLGINNNDGCTSGAGCTVSTTQDPGDTKSSAPEHAIDNNGRYEMVLLDFGTAKVNLSSIGFGWNAVQNTWSGKSSTGAWDSDFTVLAFEPSKAGAVSSALVDKTWNALDSGWSVVANYSNGTNATTVNGVTTGNGISSNIYSSYWLVGAYNPLAGGVATDMINGVATNRTTQDDYLKLKWVSGTVCAAGATCGPTGQVPEPGSLALMGVGLLGLIRMRKTRKV